MIFLGIRINRLDGTLLGEVLLLNDLAVLRLSEHFELLFEIGVSLMRWGSFEGEKFGGVE